MDNRIFLSNSSFTWSWHIMIFHVNKSGFCFPKLLLLNSSICQLLLDGARTALLGTPQLVGGFTKKCQPLFAPVESEVMKLSALANGILGIYILYNIYIYILYFVYIFILYILYIQHTIWYHLTGEITIPIPYTYAIPLEKSLASLGSLWLGTSMVAAWWCFFSTENGKLNRKRRSENALILSPQLINDINECRWIP